MKRELKFHIRPNPDSNSDLSYSYLSSVHIKQIEHQANIARTQEKIKCHCKMTAFHTSPLSVLGCVLLRM